MKAARIFAPGDLRVLEEPWPKPASGESLVRVTSVGICGSDLHWFSEARIGDARLEKPLILGHEAAGVVESGARRGQRVAIDPAIPCQKCESCLEGNPNLCVALRFAGHSHEDGAFREYMAWPDRCLYSLPEAFSDTDGAMLEPLGVALHAADLGHLRPGMTAAVFGCGPIGLLLLQAARLAGATSIIAVDRLAHRLEAARASGARIFQASDNGLADEIWAAAGKRGADVVFEAAGENEAVEAAIAAVKPGGRVVLVGIPGDDRIAFSASVARRKGLTILMTRRMKHTYPRAISLVEQGLIDVRSLVTHCFPLDRAAEAFQVAQKREGLKVVIEPT